MEAALRRSLTSRFLAWAWAREALTRGYWLAAGLYLVLDAELAPEQLVLIGTFQGATVVLAELPAGVLADAVSRRLALVVSHTVMGLGMILVALVTSFPAIVISQCMWGLGWAFASGADVAWLTDELEDPELTDRTLVNQARAMLLGVATGFLVFGSLAWATSRATAIVLAGAGMVALGLVEVARWPEQRFTPADAGRRWSQSLGTFREGLALIRTHRIVLVVVAATLLAEGSGETYTRLFERRLVELGMPTEPDPIVWFALLGMLCVAVGACALTVVERRISGSGVARRVYVIAALTGVPGLVVFAHAPNAPVAVLGVVAASAIAYPITRMAAVILVNREASSASRATAQSIMSQAEHAGEIVFGLLIAAVAGAASVPTALTCSAALLLAAGGLVATRRDRSIVPGDAPHRAT